MGTNSDQIKGKIEEAAGTLTNDEKLKNEGKKDRLVGDAKEIVNDVIDKTADVIDDVKNAVTKD